MDRSERFTLVLILLVVLTSVGHCVAEILRNPVDSSEARR